MAGLASIQALMVEIKDFMSARRVSRSVCCQGEEPLFQTKLGFKNGFLSLFNSKFDKMLPFFRFNHA